MPLKENESIHCFSNLICNNLMKYVGKCSGYILSEENDDKKYVYMHVMIIIPRS